MNATPDDITRKPARVLHAALMLACERIADGPQLYHEANTAEGWAQVYVAAAETGRTADEVLADAEPAEMSNAEREAMAAAQNLT